MALRKLRGCFTLIGCCVVFLMAAYGTVRFLTAEEEMHHVKADETSRGVSAVLNAYLGR